MKRLVIPLAILATFAFSIVSTPTVMAEDIWVLDVTVNEYDLATFDVHTGIEASLDHYFAHAVTFDLESGQAEIIDSTFDVNSRLVTFDYTTIGWTGAIHGRDAVFRMTEVQHPLIMPTYNDYAIIDAASMGCDETAYYSDLNFTAAITEESSYSPVLSRQWRSNVLMYPSDAGYIGTH